jgi:beta-lactam-binding protein with PASTA domain
VTSNVGIGRPTAGRDPRIEFKTLTLVGCLVVVVGTLVGVGIHAGHGSERPVPAASTTSLPPPGPYQVPNVVGLSASRALDVIAAAHLTNSIDDLNCPGSVLGGHVVGQNPQPGYRAASDSRVNIQISCDGPPTATAGPTTTSLPRPGPYAVPDVVGMNLLQATTTLQAAGLTNSISDRCHGSEGKGPVVSQNPPAGFRAASDSRVSIQLSCDGTSTTAGG